MEKEGNGMSGREREGGERKREREGGGGWVGGVGHGYRLILINLRFLLVFVQGYQVKLRLVAWSV